MEFFEFRTMAVWMVEGRSPPRNMRTPLRQPRTRPLAGNLYGDARLATSFEKPVANQRDPAMAGRVQLMCAFRSAGPSANRIQPNAEPPPSYNGTKNGQSPALETKLVCEMRWLSASLPSMITLPLPFRRTLA